MSVKALTCAMALRCVTPSEKLLLLALANYADEHMRCYPSQRRLAEDTCLSDRTIRTLLAAMESRLLISRVERSRQDGSRATDIITLHFHGEVAEVTSGGPVIISGGVRKPLPGGGEMASALTTFEPSINHQVEPRESAVALPAPKPSSKRARKVPEDWRPSPNDLACADAEGLIPGEIERELSKFRDHEFASPRSDWSMAFRNWIRRAAERKPPKANERPDQPSAKRTAREDNLARAFAASEAVARSRALSG